MSSDAPLPAKERLPWLDIARVLAALMILGIHWLRAGYYVGLFGQGDRVNLVIDYQGQSGGLRLFHYLLIAGPGITLPAVLTNLIGILGGLGWEAVSALILISGFSLAITQPGKSLDRFGWVSWYRKRAKRILVPFYLVALPFLVVYACVVFLVHHAPGHVLAAVVESKLLTHFHTPPLGIIISHLFLFDPWGYQWGPEFFAPAWWFVPAILLAYTTFPFLLAASRIGRGLPLLAVSAVITVAAYMLSDARVLVNESWYYIVLHESFNFSLGIVLGRLWLGEHRPVLERISSNPRAAAVAFAVFVAGNIANWSPSTRPFASMLYGPSLVLMIVFVAKLLEKRPFSRALAGIDSYDLYLVHQPFAFPIAFAAKVLFHGYAVFVGWFVFVLIATLAARVLSVVQRPFFDVPATALRAVAHHVAWNVHVKRRHS